MTLVWIRLGPRTDVDQSVLPRLSKSNRVDGWIQNNAHFEIKDFADLLTLGQPIRRPLAFTLQKRLGEIHSFRDKQQNEARDHEIARILFERSDTEGGQMLFHLAAVRIQSADNSKRQKERETTYLLSHYLKKCESHFSTKGLVETGPRMLKPKAADDVEPFTSLMSFLLRTETIAVVNEFVVDQKNKAFDSRLVTIAPYAPKIAVVSYIPFQVNSRTLSGSPIPDTYSQWKKWYSDDKIKRMEYESHGTMAHPEVYKQHTSNNATGNAFKEYLGAVDTDNHPSKNWSSNEKTASCKNDMKENETQLAPILGNEVATVRATTLDAKAFVPTTDPCFPKTPKPSLSPSTLKSVASKIQPNAPMTITKNGFRYKRISVNKRGQRDRLGTPNFDSVTLSPKPKKCNGARIVVQGTSLSTGVLKRLGTNGCPSPSKNSREELQRNAVGAKEDRSSVLRLHDMMRSSPRPGSLVQKLSTLTEPHPLAKAVRDAQLTKTKELTHVQVCPSAFGWCMDPVPLKAMNERQGVKHNGDTMRTNTTDTGLGSCQEEEPFSDKKANRIDCVITNRKRTQNELLESLVQNRGASNTGTVSPLREPIATSECDKTPLPRSCLAPSDGAHAIDALSKAVGRFDVIATELLDRSFDVGEPLVRNLISQLSAITEHVAMTRYSWSELNSFVTRRLKDDDNVIASMQAEQKTFFSQEHAAIKGMNGKLWKVFFDAFEQVIWLLVKLMDPTAKISLKSKKKPDFFRRATTILSCVQVTAELKSSGFDSSQFFRRALDSFFETTLSHFAQAPHYEILRHWTRNVFEHFEKDLPTKRPSGSSRINMKTVTLTSPKGTPNYAKEKKSISKTHSVPRNQKPSGRSLASFLPRRKRTVRKPESLRNHPAFRRGKAFAGVSKKRKSTNYEPSSKSACPSRVLDKLIHMGSLQSSLDAIKVPEHKECDFREEEVVATDDEIDREMVPIEQPRTALGLVSSNVVGDLRESIGTSSEKKITMVALQGEADLNAVEGARDKDKASTESVPQLLRTVLKPISIKYDGDHERENLSGLFPSKEAQESQQCRLEKATPRTGELENITDHPSSDRTVKRKVRESRAFPIGTGESKFEITKTRQNFVVQVLPMPDPPVDEASEETDLRSVKKRKLLSQDDRRLQTLDGVRKKSDPEKPQCAEQKPKLSLFDRLRLVVSKSINLGG
ncbi:unnamed protein product [Agarophyton chilense]